MYKEIKMNNTEDWDCLVSKLSERFGIGVSLEEVLFLIGIQEYGQGFKPYNKDEKLALIKIAIFKLFSKYGLFRYIGRDSQNWPIWEEVPDAKMPKASEQDELLKKAIAEYFAEL